MRRLVLAAVAVVGCGSGSHPGVSDGSVDAPPADAAPDAPHVPVQTYIKASNTGAGDAFGMSVALSGDGKTLAVGAPYEASNATGIGGDQANDAASQAGAVYVYVLDQGTWAQQAYVKASNAQAGDQFGYALALGDDGNTLAVSALDEQSCATGIDGDQQDNACSTSGAVYLFTRSGATWSQQAYVKPSNTTYRNGNVRAFGQSLALSGDGTTLAVGDPAEASNATGIDGDQTNTTMTLSGAVFVFVRAGQTWSQQAYVKASNTGGMDELGYSVALSRTGDVMVAGAANEASAARGVNGSQVDNSMTYAGAAYVYTRSGTTWSQRAYLKASNTDHNDMFGSAVAISASGTTIAVGAYGEASNAVGIDGDQTDNSQLDAGAVYVFADGGSGWAQQAYVKEATASNNNDSFGYAVSLSADGNTLLAGAFEARAVQGQIGAAYGVSRAGSTWSHRVVYGAASPDASDLFGFTVSQSADGSAVAIGAPGEDSAATGVGGNATDDSAMTAGAAYVVR